MVYVEHCRSNAAVTIRLEVGSRIPIVATAVGRAILAVLPPARREDTIARAVARDPAREAEIRAGIAQALADHARYGFTISIGDWQPDVNAVGVPLVAADGSGIFAFNCGAPAYQLSRERLVQEIGPRLVNLVRNVETVLNGGR